MQKYFNPIICRQTTGFHYSLFDLSANKLGCTNNSYADFFLFEEILKMAGSYNRYV